MTESVFQTEKIRRNRPQNRAVSITEQDHEKGLRRQEQIWPLLVVEPRKRAHGPSRFIGTAGLVSVSESGKLPYGRRFPVPTSQDRRDLQSTLTLQKSRMPRIRGVSGCLRPDLLITVLARFCVFPI